jgi:TonB family protein
MRSRDVSIPLALWICAAVCAHFLFGTGGAVVAQIHDDRTELWKLSHEASDLARHGGSIEVSLGDGSEPKDDVAPPPPPPPPPQPEPEKAKPEATAKPVEKPVPPKPEVKKDDEKKVVVQKKPEEKKDTPPPPEPKIDHRIAVRQQVTPDQKDNPEAKFIADEANHVQEEKVATQTSHDRDDPDPTPAGAHQSLESNPGDSEHQRIAEAEQHKGEKNRAPGEHGTDFDVLHEPHLPKPSPASAANAGGQPLQRGLANDPRALSPSNGQQAEPQPAPGGASPASPDIEGGETGSWSFDPTTRPSGATGPTSPNAGASNPLPGGKMWSLPGLGQQSAPGEINTNINPGQIASIVGEDNLRKLREADGERRKSEHRGSWQASNFDRWRSAIENYVSSVKNGNQTALNTARVPFASYLNGMHNRIHPIFADAFLESLDGLPASHPMNDKHLVTKLEIVLTREGHLKKMGIVRTSGITAFDIAALDAVDRAAPFGPAPSAIISPDGNVYLHWEFHRDEVFACSTMGAQPFILNNPSGPKNEEPAPPTPGPRNTPHERGTPSPSPNDTREGSLQPPSLGRRRAARAAVAAMR